MRAGNCGPAGYAATISLPSGLHSSQDGSDIVADRNASTNIAIKNITFRRVTGTVQSPGAISCRKGNPCTIT